MSMDITPHIGFCCKYQTDDKDTARSMNQASTTLTSLRKMKRQEVYDKLAGLARHNIDTLFRQLNWIATQPKETRMFRITSDFLPAYVTDDFAWVYRDKDMRELVEKGLAPVRAFADANNIRLCTHPGQFTTLCSQKPDVVDRSIEDLNYHAYLAEIMGFGDTWHSSGFAINIHANNNLDPGLERLKDTIKNRLSLTLRNLLTIENDEFGCSVDEMIAAELYHRVAMVLDIHHHWIESGGQYIQPDDPRIHWFKHSWCGVRPLGHFSTSSEELLEGACSLTQPNYTLLNSAGHKPSKLRAHSFGCWNQGSNDWALGHLSWTDLEVEAKGKQLASRQLYDRAVASGVLTA
jgi:UV DNA damage repair endonuclease